MHSNSFRRANSGYSDPGNGGQAGPSSGTQTMPDLVLTSRRSDRNQSGEQKPSTAKQEEPLHLVPILARRLEAVASVQHDSDDVRHSSDRLLDKLVICSLMFAAQSSSQSSFPRISASSGTEVPIPALVRTIEGKHGAKPLQGSSNLSVSRSWTLRTGLKQMFECGTPCQTEGRCQRSVTVGKSSWSAQL
jgi:hypothetical protein